MKKFGTWMTVCCVSFMMLSILSSCKKEENWNSAVFELLNRTDIATDTIPAALTSWVYGFKLKPTEDGYVSRIGMKLPIAGTFQVKLWDLDKGVVLAEEKLTSTQKHEEVFTDVGDIDIAANTTLGIAVQASSFYKIRRTDGRAFDFPIVDGNLSILSYHETRFSENPSAAFPGFETQHQLAPCVDVIFIADK
ncbi:MAG: hypothetical protein LW630_07125 [Saprospiraceae bacterium]|jgi:hypothetical protein|nr:hypothetical protein [Saprospiraceae bacterium]